MPPQLSKDYSGPWLETPHKPMPNLILKLEDRDDLIAYIVSLRGVASQVWWARRRSAVVVWTAFGLPSKLWSCSRDHVGSKSALRM